MYQKYRWKSFRPHTRDLKTKLVSCGGSVINVITGLSPKIIHDIHPDNSDWTAEFVLAFLEAMGIKNKEIKHNFYEKRKDFERLFFDDHLMLAILGCNNTELTWVVLYGKRAYHIADMFKNYRGFDLFLNFPIEKLYLLYPDKRR